MGLLTKPADFTATTLSVSDLNAVKNRVYDEFGTTANGQGNITDVNVATAAAIDKTKIADTAVVCGNTVAPGTQTITRPTVFTGGLTFSAGTGSATPSVGGVLTSSVTAFTTTSGAEETAVTYPVPANTLVTTARGLRITAFGSAANNANAKTIRLYLGSVAQFSPSVTTGSARVWTLDVKILRTGANAQLIPGLLFDTPAGGGAGVVVNTIGTGVETEANALTLSLTLDGVAAGDLSFRGWIVEAI